MCLSGKEHVMSLRRYIKIAVIAAAMCIVSAIIFTVNAEIIETNDSYVLTGASFVTNPSSCDFTTVMLEGKEYIHITPDLTKASNPTLDNTTLNILTNDYGYIKISYRTNVDTGVPMRVGSTDTWLMVAEVLPIPDEQWHTVILEADKNRKLNPAVTKGIKVLFTPLTSVYADTLYANSYTDLEYIGFFKTKEAAEAFVPPFVKEVPKFIKFDIKDFINKTQCLTVIEEMGYQNDELFPYLSLRPVRSDSSNPTIINTTMDVDTNFYRYMSVKYRTNINNGKNIRLISTDTWGLVAEFKPIADSEWHTAVCKVAAGRALNPGVNKDIPDLRVMMTPLTSTPANTLPENAYTDIAFITFTIDNPVLNVTFTTDYPGEDKNSPEKLAVSVGDALILPKSPYNVTDGVFKGWLCNKDAKLYDEGAEIKVETGGDVQYTAIYELERDLPAIKKLDLYEQGIYAFGGVTDSTAKKTVKDGKIAIKVNISENDDPKKAYLGCYSFGDSGVDLSKYKYAAVSYYFESDKEPKDTRMTMAVHNIGAEVTGLPLLKGSSVNATATTYLTANKWDYAFFDISECQSKLIPSSYMDLQSLNLSVFKETGDAQIVKDGTLYVASMVFFEEMPNITYHSSFMNGYEGGLFKPSGNVTRAEACTIAARLITGGNIPKSQSCDFTDIDSDAWYFDAIAYCRSKGYLASYSGEFYPGQPITRAEFTELVYNIGFIKDEAEGTARVFTDVDASHPRFNVISAASKSGLINGYDNGDGTFSFKPDNGITRAEAVKVLNNARGIKASSDYICADLKYLYHDVTEDYWAYADIGVASVAHSETDGKWIELFSDPELLLGSAARFSLDKGAKYIAELDEETANRIEDIRSTTAKTEVIGNVYYVSSSNGNDDNDGKSEATAWKTIGKVNTYSDFKTGDAVLFKRGDVFRERLTVKGGLTYSAYGSGEKPRIYGSPENGADASKWSLVEGTTDLWVYAVEMTDVGLLVFNDGEQHAIKVVPDLVKEVYYVSGTNRTVPFDPVQHMKENEVFSDIRTTKIANTLGKVFYRTSKGNPGEIFDSIEFNTASNIINVANEENVTIDNLCIKYGGYHGIGAGSTKNLTVTNCEVGWIGGCPLTFSSAGVQERFGNGIEIYGSCENYTVDNCYVYQCYDAGVTHQFSGGSEKDNSMINIKYMNNVIEDCSYIIEYFNTANYNGAIRDGRDYLIENNILRRAGYGWGKQRPNNETVEIIKGWTGHNEYAPGTFIIKNNIFDRSTRSLLQINAKRRDWLPIMDGNTYIQIQGEVLGQYNYSTDYLMNYTVDYVVREVFGDKNSKVVIVGNEFADKG